MLDRKYSTVYNKTPKKEFLWKTQEYALFAKLKKNTFIFQKARKVKMVIRHNVKFADWLQIGNITKKILKNVLLNMKDGLTVIQTRFLKIKELIITGIKKKSWIRLENQEKKMDIKIQKPIANVIEKKLNVIILSDWLLNLVYLTSQIIAKNVNLNQFHKPIIMTMQSLWMSFGFAVSVMEKSIELIYQRERLNLWTPKGDAIVQTTEETCRGEFEAIPPPRNWSVGLLWPKVIAWLRHTAGCSFYQGQCITNDLWIINLRSTGI